VPSENVTNDDVFNDVIMIVKSLSTLLTGNRNRKPKLSSPPRKQNKKQMD